MYPFFAGIAATLATFNQTQTKFQKDKQEQINILQNCQQSIGGHSDPIKPKELTAHQKKWVLMYWDTGSTFRVAGVFDAWNEVVRGIAKRTLGKY